MVLFACNANEIKALSARCFFTVKLVKLSANAVDVNKRHKQVNNLALVNGKYAES